MLTIFTSMQANNYYMIETSSSEFPNFDRCVQRLTANWIWFKMSSDGLTRLCCFPVSRRKVHEWTIHAGQTRPGERMPTLYDAVWRMEGTAASVECGKFGRARHRENHSLLRFRRVLTPVCWQVSKGRPLGDACVVCWLLALLFHSRLSPAQLAVLAALAALAAVRTKYELMRYCLFYCMRVKRNI